MRKIAPGNTGLRQVRLSQRPQGGSHETVGMIAVASLAAPSLNPAVVLVFAGGFVLTVTLQPNITLPQIMADADRLATHVVYALGFVGTAGFMVVIASPLLAAEVTAWRKAYQWNALAVGGLAAAGIFLVILFHDIL